MAGSTNQLTAKSPSENDLRTIGSKRLPSVVAFLAGNSVRSRTSIGVVWGWPMGGSPSHHHRALLQELYKVKLCRFVHFDLPRLL
jgi:hypothetical protein